MAKSLLKRVLLNCKGMIARYWIDPLETVLWEMVGLNQSSRWYAVRRLLVMIKDLGRLVYTGFRVNITRWNGTEWSIVYVYEDSTESEKELQHLLFSETFKEENLGRVFVWQLPPLIRQFALEDCLVICDMNRLIKWRFRMGYAVRVFPWVHALLDITGPMDTIIGRMTKYRRKNVLKKLDKHNFKYGISRNLADFDHFYYKMYLPYITERYQDRKLIRSYEALLETFKGGGALLNISHQNNLAGTNFGTLRKYGKTFSAMFVGVDQDLAHSVKQDIFVALYWHIIRWAHANHLHSVDFGRTRARLFDGVYEFKRRWGIQHKRDILTHTMWTFVGKNLPLGLVRRLNDLAFIAEVGEEYRCVLFEHDSAGLSDKELENRMKIINQTGLNGLLVLKSPPE